MFFLGGNQKKQPAKATFHSTKPLDCQEKSKFGFVGAVVSDVGCVRTNNEDNYLLGRYMNALSSDHSEAAVFFSNPSGLWYFAGVFDGMGGGEMGEVASRDTAAILLDALDGLKESSSKEEVDLCVRKGFLDANNRIVTLQKKHRIFGTTGTLLCSNGAAFKIYHLGDSRAYLARQGELLQLTKDQTLAQMKLEVGMYAQDDPAVQADKHKLTEYIGRDWTRENIKPVESRWTPVRADDCILLCSDGLYDMCTNDEIANILCDNDTIEKKAAALVETAISKGGEDNITCAVVSFT